MSDERLRFEVAAALDRAGAWPAVAGLSIRPEVDELVVLDAVGAELCRIPRHRLVVPDAAEVAAFVGRFVGDVGMADQALAAIAVDEWCCAPDSDEVLIRIGAEFGLRLDRCEVLAWAADEV